VHQYGIAAPESPPQPGEAFTLRDVIEKPNRGEAPSQLAIAARYIFSPDIFDALRETKPGKGGEIQLTDAIRLLIRNGERVLGLSLPPGETRYDIGNFESYFQAFIEFALCDHNWAPKCASSRKSFWNGRIAANKTGDMKSQPEPCAACADSSLHFLF
jgi:UTP--glucose-1-phosphate uridylyltransferase